MINRIVFLLSLCLLFPVSCGQNPPETSTKTEEQGPRFIIGLIPEQNLFKQLERYEPLARYLSEKIGQDIEVKVLPRYGNILDNFVSSGMDGAFFGSFTYALAHAKLEVEAVARPVSTDGTSTYHGLIFVRKDSRIRGVKEMEGKSFVFVDKATTAGYLLPLAYFKEEGVLDYKTYLGETYFSGTHEDAIYDVLDKKVDIGAAKNTVFNRLAEADGRITSELMILKRSPDVPENGLAVRKDLDDAIKRKLKISLLDMHVDPNGREILRKFGAQRFIETTDEDYASVYAYAKQIGLNLATYHYWNE